MFKKIFGGMDTRDVLTTAGIAILAVVVADKIGLLGFVNNTVGKVVSTVKSSIAA